MILIVDDSIEWCKTMKQHINMIAPNEEVIECYKGLEAIKAYRHHHPGIVLMDIEMSDIDGFKATRMLIKEFPEARIVIVSQYNDKAYYEEAESAGAIGYVTKDNLAPLKKYLLNDSHN